MKASQFVDRTRPLSDWILAVVLFFVGWFLNRTNLLTPIHEFFHWIVAKVSGLDAFFVSPLIIAVKDETNAVIMAGWFGEIMLYSMTAIVLSIIGSSWIFPSGTFALAAAYTAYIHGFWSEDFGESLLHTIKDRYPAQTESWQIAMYEDTLAWIFRWLIVVGIVCLSASSIVVLYRLIKKTRKLHADKKRKAFQKLQLHH